MSSRARISLIAMLLASSLAHAADDGLTGRIVLGYQGWFGCPGDYKDNKAWQHWFLHGVAPQNLTVDLVPDPASLPESALCATGLKAADGSELKLFSSQNADVVNAQFAMMQAHGIDGVALQRFVTALTEPTNKDRHDHQLDLVKSAAEKTGRRFFITYDISGAGPKIVVQTLLDDWRALAKGGVTQSPAYWRDHGKPVVELWGFGLGDRPGDPDDVAALIRALKKGGDGVPAAYVIGGVPTHWRTLDKDSKKGKAWASIYRSYDVISPWLVGRFDDDAAADALMQEIVIPDLAEAKKAGVQYMPVTFPGYSARNLLHSKGKEQNAVLNKTPRQCGDFLWHQYARLLKAGVTMIYGAMFDEFDEGTALQPAVTNPKQFPAGASLVPLAGGGCNVPSDYYLEITGKAAELLRGGDRSPPRNVADVIKNR
ncbi:MAG TPA: glycoside hydrolase family 71/99-like protein [Nevskiaceae bacterium]|nr:glycoside hydrolase family 71/99-like protein [Nevskiaceae bacterium]